MYELQCTVCALLVVDPSFMFLFSVLCGDSCYKRHCLQSNTFYLLNHKVWAKSMYVNCIYCKLFHFYTSDFPVSSSRFSNMDTRCSWHFWEGRQPEVVSQYRDLFKHFGAAQVSWVLSWHALWQARRGERASRATRTLWYSWRLGKSNRTLPWASCPDVFRKMIHILTVNLRGGQVLLLVGNASLLSL